jgi:quinol monooxygenase YgiN
MSTQALYIRHTAKPGKRDEVKRIWEKYAKSYTETAKGQLASFYCYDNNDPDSIVVFGLQDEAHAGDFQKQAWYKDYQAETAALLAGPSELRFATPQHVKGVSA